MVKVYCLAIAGAECEDLVFTLSEQIAREWLRKYKTGSVIVYTVTDETMTQDWDDVWHYHDDDGELKKGTE